MKLRLLESARAEHEAEAVLQAPELALDGGAATVERAPFVRMPRGMGEPGSMRPFLSGITGAQLRSAHFVDVVRVVALVHATVLGE